MILRNNLKLAFRKLWRDKFYTILNGVGLAIGMAAALLIFLWAQDELSFDRFHENGDRIHRVLAAWTFAGNEEIGASTPLPLADAAREQVPEVEKFTRTWNVYSAVFKHGDQLFDPTGVYLADAEFLEIFDFPFLKGDRRNALAQPNNVVLTAALARQIFGTIDVVGQPLKMAGQMDLIVSGILNDIPSNSHLQFDALIPFRENYDKFMRAGSTHWNAYNFDSYLLLRPGVDVLSVGKKLTALIPEGSRSEDERFELQALTDIYLGSDFLNWSNAPGGDIGNIRLVGIIGLLILLIACINYVNMSTARSAHRAKSTSVHKIVGASRSVLFGQYLTEAVVLVLLACVLAIGLANLSLGLFEELSGKDFIQDQLIRPTSLLIVFGTGLLAVLLAGVHPAVQLSAFKPIEALRGNTQIGSGGSGALRKALVIGQFACSGALIVGSLIMLLQLDFVKRQKLGYNKEHIFSFRCNDATPLQMKQVLQGHPGMIDITASDQPIYNLSNRYGGFDYEGKDPESNPYIRQLIVDEAFLDFFDLELLEGRWFRPGNRDTTSFIINEKAVTALGLENPVGSWMEFNGVRGSIVGVAKDFHHKSLHHEIDQMIFVQNPKWMRRVYVKTTGKQAAQAIATARSKYQEMEPNTPFNYQFIDESYDNLYKTESRIGKLFALFAGLAVLISCLGIFGLAAYTAERRTKEIGVRKVLGASVTHLIGLLSKDFVVLVGISLLIASPVAWYFLRGWLAEFAFRIEIRWWMFAIAGVIALAIALLTVSFHSIRAALNNPVDSLRSE